MTTTQVDPVGNPSAYQQMILDYLGEDDPAEVQAATAATLAQLRAEAGEQLRVRPAPAEWSVLELLGHIMDAEIVSAARYRWVISQEQPALTAYDQDLWVSNLQHNAADPDSVLGLFSALRAANVELWRTSSADQKARIGLHSERGPESFELLFRMIAGHDRFHIEQIEQTLRAVRSA